MITTHCIKCGSRCPFRTDSFVGALAVAGYAARQGISVAEYVAQQGPVLDPDQVAKAVADLAADPGYDRDAYLLTADGLRPAG